jgi:succinate dehydrogenase / fumarate reductase membrane anchor subunit
VALIPLLGWFVWGLFAHLLAGRDVLIHWLAAPGVGIFASLALGATCYHAYLGVRVVIEDYVHAPTSRWFLLIAVRFLSLGVAFADVFMILRLSMRSF